MAVPCCGSSQGRWALKTFPLPHRRERSKVPYIVRQCVEEIERRGMEEVGIYRVSGVATDIQALKAAFDVSECRPGKYGIGCGRGAGSQGALRGRCLLHHFPHFLFTYYFIIF